MDRSVAFAIDDVKEDVEAAVLKLHEDELHFGFLKVISSLCLAWELRARLPLRR